MNLKEEYDSCVSCKKTIVDLYECPCQAAICLDCLKKTNRKEKCYLGHKMSWKNSLKKCSSCKNFKISGFSCDSCVDNGFCVSCLDHQFSRKQCPNNHALTMANLQKQCSVCLELETIALICDSCHFFLCNRCQDENSTNFKVLTISNDSSARIWTCEKEKSELVYENDTIVYSAAQIDHNTVAFGDKEGYVKFWKLKEDLLIKKAKVHENIVSGMVFQKEKECLITTGPDSKINIFNVIDFSLRYSTKIQVSIWEMIHIDKNSFVVSGWERFSNYVLNIDNKVEVIKELQGHKGLVKAMISLENQKFASGGEDKRIIVWDTKDAKQIGCLKGHESQIMTLERIDAKTILSGGKDNTLRIWDIEQLVLMKVIEFSSFVISIKSVPSGRCIVGLGIGAMLELNLRSGEIKKKFKKEHYSYIWKILKLY